MQKEQQRDGRHRQPLEEVRHGDGCWQQAGQRHGGQEREREVVGKKAGACHGEDAEKDGVQLRAARKHIALGENNGLIGAQLVSKEKWISLMVL